MNQNLKFDISLTCQPIFTENELIYADKSRVYIKKINDTIFNSKNTEINENNMFSDQYSIEEEDVERLILSPKREYLVTMARFRGKDGKGNLTIWDTKTGTELYRMSNREDIHGEDWSKIVMFYSRPKKIEKVEKDSEFQFKINEPESEPESEKAPKEKTESLYANSEKIGILTNNQDIIFLIRKEDGSLSKFKSFNRKKVRFWSLGAKGQFVVCCDGKPLGGVFLYDVNSNFKEPISQIPFSNVENCRIEWNVHGDQVLIRTTTPIDDSSYYGTSRLYLMSGKGNYQNQVNIESPIHDIQWSPKGSEFIAIYGRTPNTKAAVYNQRGQSVVDLGSGPRNTIKWNPQGTIFCLAGIRSMQGRLEFWSRKLSKMFGIGQSNEASVLEWSPSGNYFSAATVTPDMNVSNKIQIFKYNGVLKTTKNYDVGVSPLYFSIWQNHPENKYPEVRPSPRALEEGKAFQSQEKLQQSSGGKYVPPHLRK